MLASSSISAKCSYIKTALSKERLAFVDGIPIEMNQKSYAAALQLIRLMEFDDSLAAAAEPFNWYHNLIHQMFEYEENNFNNHRFVHKRAKPRNNCHITNTIKKIPRHSLRCRSALNTMHSIPFEYWSGRRALLLLLTFASPAYAVPLPL